MRLTRDDERARRICSLALEFMNARGPVSSSAIARAFYPTLSADSFRRAFSRDRETLAACGIVVEECMRTDEGSSWRMREDLFATGVELEPLEAATLEVACAPLLGDASFPLADDLRLALAKISRSFAETSVVSVPRQEESRAFSTLRTCLMNAHAAQVSYVDAQGRQSDRTIVPYGLFELRGRRYLVADGIDAATLQTKDELRVYRIDRFLAAEELTKTTYRVPEDFSVEDWRRLPFQIGGEKTDVTFLVPAEREQDVRRASLGQGSFVKKDGGLHWSVGACSIDEAASWAVAEGIVPVFPEALVNAWTAKLEGVVSHGA